MSIKSHPSLFAVVLLLGVFLSVEAQSQKSDLNSTINSRDIAVGSSLTAAGTSSWLSPSGRFSFGFYRAGKGLFSAGIQLIVSPDKTVVVWTWRDLHPFPRDAFLNFTGTGIFLTPSHGSTPSLLNFSSKATSAAMLDNGNFVVYSSNSSVLSSISNVSYIGTGPLPREAVPCSRRGASYYNCRPAASSNPYTRRCSSVFGCRSSPAPDSNSSSSNIVWRSFDYPTDTIMGSQFLPCGYNLSSNATDSSQSSPGTNILSMQCDGNLVFYSPSSPDPIWASGTSGEFYRSLILDESGRLYLSSPDGNDKSLSGYESESIPDSKIYWATLGPDNIFRLQALDLRKNLTMVVNEVPYYKDLCQSKDVCGVNSYCLLANSKPECRCVPGSAFIDPENQFAGCQRSYLSPSCRLRSFFDLSMKPMEHMGGLFEQAYSVVSITNRDNCSKACNDDCDCDAALFNDNGRCAKLKLPLASGRIDDSDPSVAFFKVAAAASNNRTGTARRIKKVRVAAVVASVAVTAIVWLLVIAAGAGAYWFLFGRLRVRWSTWELALTQEIAPRYFSYEEIVNGIEGKNRTKQEIGKGSHGTVYKAALPIGGKMADVAVKELCRKDGEGEKDFQAEMRIIGRAHHVNIVRLLGFCHEQSKRLLVYEYMFRGSLADHIFTNRAAQWPRWEEHRMKILLDVARGIHYLHSECETKIIHRDIKPENILIAEDWTAKITDFGIARLLANGPAATEATTEGGTAGYVPPECAGEGGVNGMLAGEVLTEKVDVYSYGVVVLETMCGRRNREVNLCELARKRDGAKMVGEMVMGKMKGDMVKGKKGVDLREVIERVVKLGILCVQTDPMARPEMEKVVMMLEEAVDMLDPPATGEWTEMEY
ncbi:G-type lectin S-receptor-like serine/threonine-protein kinase RLK1 [Apostasia shenzhenica]|uniref:G-type lectin S-receptor-like serine/threonine-protein kinase RLK1 n=1 Tax=Apostasia shenzhenica TaxID=1088818 RepID=A0A2I0B169_9ASPA|nr:G-type lectin S-receptor-like serine/threonine-protein kinase RLK1 [Apostasia shenzhenica]